MSNNNKEDNNFISSQEEEKQIHLVIELQKMNFHVRQLPFSPKCPDAPKMGASLSLFG
jgi:hypothetical protein